MDHATGRIKFVPQASSNTATTLREKHALEREAANLGFRIQSLVSDNGIFTSKEFQLDVHRRNQSHHLSGAGAKHQNGFAENGIKTVSNLARAMLIHAALWWPTSHNLSLWPLCLEHAVYIWNRIPDKTDGLSPEEKWTGVKSDHHELRRLHPWGCPAYVLKPTLQDGKKLPKWKPKSRQGKFVGLSSVHASNVALVLNQKTSQISPQFHLLFDDFFTTVKGIEVEHAPDLDHINWEEFIAIHGTEKYIDDEDHVPSNDSWSSSDTHRQPQREMDLEEDDLQDAPLENVLEESPTGPTPEASSLVEPEVEPSNGTEVDSSVLNDQDTEMQLRDNHAGHPPSAPDTDEPRTEPGTGTRLRRPNRRYFNDDFVNAASVGDLTKLKCYLSLSEAEHKLKRKMNGFERDSNFINCVNWSNDVSEIIEDACGETFQQVLATDLDLNYMTMT